VDSGFWLTVDDNGKGFHPDHPPVTTGSGDGLRFSSGNGLANMKRRLDEIGGEFELKSSPGEGTNVKFVVNIKT
jgi:signal transduction histidine kinase